MAFLKRLGLVFVFVALYALALAVWTHLPARPEGPTAAQLVAARLDRELPLGTPRATVERWLSARGVDHFAYADVEDCWDLPETGLRRDGLGAVVGALMTAPNRDRERVQVFFVFDKEGRTVKNLVK